MWIVKRIEEADFGCEERLPGEPLLVVVSLENDEGQICRFECADNWLTLQEIEEGDEWPEDVEALQQLQAAKGAMTEWMEGYFAALEELDEVAE